HDKVGQSLRFRDSVDSDDIVVADRSGGPRLTKKTLSSRSGSRKLRRNHLDRDDAMQSGIECLEDDASLGASDLFEDFIMIEFTQLIRLVRRIEEIERHLLASFDLILRQHRERRYVAELRDRQSQRLAATRLCTVQIASQRFPRFLVRG